jgi:dTDP-4-amino-4,6-dideoxygalactose transaminase
MPSSVAAMAAEVTSAPVPFLDLGHVNEPVRDEFLRLVGELVDTGAFTNGPPVQEFEQQFAEYCGVDRCIGVASGLDALRLALRALDVGPGDEVIVPANTFLATLEAVSQVGARPMPVDVSLADYNVDPDAVEAAVGARTRAILPVHLYGQLADMVAIRRIAASHGLSVVEDACQAHGATRDLLRAGAAGDAAAFSFYPGKNLGAFGDAGALVTGSTEVDRRARALREHGQTRKYVHGEIGYTARLDTIQALALLLKLPGLDGANARRRAAAATYTLLLEGVGDVVLPPVAPASEPVWHLYEIRTAHRDALAGHLRERGIATGLHYPQVAPLAAAYSHLGHTPGSFPVSETLAGELLSLPIFPGIAEAQLAAVADGVESFFAHGG